MPRKHNIPLNCQNVKLKLNLKTQDGKSQLNHISFMMQNPKQKKSLAVPKTTKFETLRHVAQRAA